MSGSTSSTPADATPASELVLLARGVIARLSIWPALRIAVDQSWGGPASAQKRTWLASVIVDAFEEQTNPPPDAEYVEEMLLQVMEDEFETNLEDGSAEGVADDIIDLWNLIQQGGEKAEAKVKELEEKADKLKGKKIQVEEGATNDSDWEDESGDEEDIDDGEEDAPPLLDSSQKPKSEPEVDEDGFTMVKGKVGWQIILVVIHGDDVVFCVHGLTDTSRGHFMALYFNFVSGEITSDSIHGGNYAESAARQQAQFLEDFFPQESKVGVAGDDAPQSQNNRNQGLQDPRLHRARTIRIARTYIRWVNLQHVKTVIVNANHE
ncbi:hypothetical protein K474DRAFT_1674137 [Panus rudis PR-1116 ss-1]|nr:hypothetical protein K474DRAFT_1674137 [Panus rudis PR-1116 ss-1]